MRLKGGLISRRRYEAIVDTERSGVDRRQILRVVKKASMELDYYVKYQHRKQEPYVYVKSPNQSEFGNGTNYAYIFVRDTTQDNLKRVIIKNIGFDKESLEILATTILLNLGIPFSNSGINQQESQPCPDRQLDLFQLG